MHWSAIIMAVSDILSVSLMDSSRKRHENPLRSLVWSVESVGLDGARHANADDSTWIDGERGFAVRTETAGRGNRE